MNSMVCKNCGTEPVEGSVFCPYCGQKLNNSDESSSEAPSDAVSCVAGTDTDISSAPAHSKKNAHRALTLIVTFILSVVLFVFSCTTALLYVVRESVSNKTISKTVSAVDFDMLIEDYDISDMILDYIDPDTIEYYDIQPSSISKFLDRASVKEFASEKLSEYIEALAQGDSGYSISKKDFSRFLKRNETAIQKDFGCQLTESDYDSIENYLTDNNILKSLSVDSILTNTGINPNLLRWPLSVVTFIISLILFAAVLLALFFINRHHCRTAFLSAGIVFCIVGLLYSGLGFSLYSVTSVIAGGSLNLSLIRGIFAQTQSITLLLGLVILAAGIVLTAVYIIIKKITGKKGNRANGVLS